MTVPSMVVINLQRRPDRWEKWVQEARKQKLEGYLRWEGVDGTTLTLTPEIKDLFRDNDFNMRPGVIGCALTHMNIWLYIIEARIPSLIVFEDDACFNESFKIPELPVGWDLFYFGGPPFKGIYPPGVPISEDVIIPQLPADLYFTTLAYMISYTGACKLVDRLGRVGFNRAADWFMRDTFDNLNVFCYKKLIVYPAEDAGSDVKDRRIEG